MLPQMMPLPWFMIFFLVLFSLVSLLIFFDFQQIPAVSKKKLLSCGVSVLSW